MSESVTSSRLSVDPALPTKTLFALRRSPEEWEKQRQDDQKSGKEFEWIGAGSAFFAFIVVLLMSDNLAVAIAAFVLAVILGKGGISIWISRRKDFSQRLLRENKNRFVDPARLHERERDLLVRAQIAVTRILGSPLHEKGILNDRVQEEVVLNYVEWSIAQQASSQSERRYRIESVPVLGERSRQAAKHALASLDTEQVESVRQVDTIVRMADQVIEAERELLDRANALRLENMQVEDPWIYAAAKVDSDSLNSLLRARDMGRNIEELIGSGKKFF